jgi:adenylate kinase family enzyme
VRIAVIGSTGSGKTTLAKTLAARLGVPFIELDALHFDPGWTALSQTDPAEFVRRVDAATAAGAWVSDGNYKLVRPLVWARATHLVWLDYGRPLIMYRVIRRSVARSVRQTELWAGNREQWRNMLRADHPIWWAWKHWRRHRREWGETLALPEFSHLVVQRVRHPRDAEAAVRRLIDAAPSRP